MDIIYFRPMTELAVNKPENKDKKAFVCISDYGHSTGFNMATPDSEFFKILSENLNNEYRPSSLFNAGGRICGIKYLRLLNYPKGVR